MSMTNPDKRRIFRPKPPGYFPDKNIVAVFDGVDNIVYFNETYTGDRILERRALFMREQILHRPPGYMPPPFISASNFTR